MPKLLRSISIIILIVITILVNLAGYTLPAWIVGVVILLVTAFPMMMLAEKLEEKNKKNQDKKDV